MELPTVKSEVKNYNPRLMVVYGRPKAGKSSIMAALDSNLIIDLEDGYRHLSAMKIQARSAEELFNIADLIRNKCMEIKKYPYRFITIDNATRLEEMCLPYAASQYRKLPIGMNWGLKKDPTTGKMVPDPAADIRTLPQGAGYTYVRNAVRDVINVFKPLCETLILVAHVKDKQIRKDSQELSEMNIDLSGKLGDIICGESDAIGLVYRDGKETHITFKAGDDSIKGARSEHLAEKDLIVIQSDEEGKLHYNVDQLFI